MARTTEFLTLDLSSFYFDIRKDCLYCDDVNSKKRKDCIIVLNVILETLLKWFAPILVFTTEEIYNLIKKDNKSIHEHEFLQIPKSWANLNLNDKWESLNKIKQAVNIAIEEKRTKKVIGSSLEAEIEIFLDKKNYDLLENLDLTEYFITSKAKRNFNKDNKNEIKVLVKKSSGVKCERCWKIVEKKCMRCEKIIQKKKTNGS